MNIFKSIKNRILPKKEAWKVVYNPTSIKIENQEIDEYIIINNRFNLLGKKQLANKICKILNENM